MKLHRYLICLSLLLLTPPGNANVVGTDAQNFNPITDGLDFVTVHSSETLNPGILNFGVFLNYGVNTLPVFQQNQASRTKFNDTLTGLDLNFGVGLMKNWDAGLSFPHIIGQTIDDNTVQGYFSKKGNTEVRLNTKYRWFGNDDGGFATVFSVNFDRVENNPYAGEGAGPTLNFEFVYDRQLTKLVAAAANLGYRMRDSGTAIAGFPIQPFEDQIIGSLAASYLWNNVRLISEIFGSFPAQETDENTNRTQSSLELLLGMKMNLTHTLAWHAGFGTELSHGTSTPDWRVYTGVNYAVGPLWGKDQMRIYQKGQPEVDDDFENTPEAEEVFVVEGINFEFDSFALTPLSQEVLKRLAEYLKKPPALKQMVIEGHTDSLGPEEYNQKLSDNRAKAVLDFLASQGITKNKLSSKGYGETKPIADNGNFQGRTKNRRVEFQISRQ